MKDDSLSDVAVCGLCGGPLPCLTHSVGKHTLVHAAQDAAMRSIFEREIWNAAIEAAAKVAEDKYMAGLMEATAIRKLRK